jgi:predicted TIM-barrel fold metal-dependent hydrolase
MTLEFPRIISVDDHVIEPRDVWTSRLPARYRDVWPRVQRIKGILKGELGAYSFVQSDEEGAYWADAWFYEDTVTPMTRGLAVSGYEADERQGADGVTFETMLPGCFTQSDRLLDMDTNYTDVMMCFPTYSRFCGQRFLTAEDKELALLCVQAYNDFQIDEWCAGAGYGRLIPLTLIPLWDPKLAAAEVRRCADKGSHAVAFSEAPYELGLPSIHHGHWDPFIDACAETDTVINMHIGSSGMLTTTSKDAPGGTVSIVNAINTIKAFTDWMTSGQLAKHPELRIAFSEGQVGWIPYYIERITSLWERDEQYGGQLKPRSPKHPREYLPQVFGCIYDDLHGLESRDKIGMDQIMFETDYPHLDSTWPNSKAVVQKLVDEAGLSDEETYKFVRGNAIKCYGLDKYFGVTK